MERAAAVKPYISRADVLRSLLFSPLSVTPRDIKHVAASPIVRKTTAAPRAEMVVGFRVPGQGEPFQDNPQEQIEESQYQSVNQNSQNCHRSLLSRLP